MSEQMVINLAREAVGVALMVVGPILAASLITGVVVSIFQATTQINEQTLAFIPKIVAVMITLVVLGPWMLRVLVAFGTEVLQNISTVVR